MDLLGFLTSELFWLYFKNQDTSSFTSILFLSGMMEIFGEEISAPLGIRTQYIRVERHVSALNHSSILHGFLTSQPLVGR